MAEGWIKIHRQLSEHWIWTKYPFSYGQAWIDLLMLANHEDEKVPYKGEIVICKRGDVSRSISSLAERWHWGREKTRNFLTLLEKDGMVVVNATKNRTTITLVKYDDFQVSPSTNPTTNRQRTRQRTDNEPDINKNDKNDKNDKKNIYIVDEVIDYLNQKTGKSFKKTVDKTKRLINARQNEGFTLEDFKKVIDIKCKEWLSDDKMCIYLRPETLFGTKFENYLNQGGVNSEEEWNPATHQFFNFELPKV